MEILDNHRPPAPAGWSPFELGAWTGKSQAFDFIERHCSAAEARCLKQIRESRSYESLGVTWEEFCSQHAQISRSRADKLIHKLDEFGESYFQLADITPISAESFRQIAAAVTPEGLEIEGEVIPITQENAMRIRQAVQSLRADLRRARELEPDPSIIDLRVSLDACFAKMSRRAGSQLGPGTLAAMHGLVNYSHAKLKDVVEMLSR